MDKQDHLNKLISRYLVEKNDLVWRDIIRLVKAGTNTIVDNEWCMLSRMISPGVEQDRLLEFFDALPPDEQLRMRDWCGPEHRHDPYLIMDAARHDHEKLVSRLLELGFNPNTHAVSRGETALMIAAAEGSLKSLDLLLGAGANPDFSDDKGRTAFMAACGVNKDCDKVLRRLFDAGADVDMVDRFGMTARSIAVAAENFSAMAMFAEIDAASLEGETQEAGLKKRASRRI